MGDANQRDVDIVIIGAGVAGPALAAALVDSGLEILLLEKSDQPADTARGDRLQPRTLEILERWGALGAFFEAGACKSSGSRWYTADGHELFYSDIAALDLPHPYIAYLNHEAIVDTLVDFATRHQNVSLLRPIRNWWLQERREDGITLRVGLPGDDDVIVRARLLVGADGRNSRVRRVFDIDSRTHVYQRSIAVMFGTPVRPDSSMRVYVGDRQIVPLIPRADGSAKIGVPIAPDEVADWRKAPAEELSDRLRELAPALEVRNLRFADVYPPIDLRAAHWTRDNVVLIGDACHAMHPARSQGMNIAIRCVDALANEIRKVPSGGNFNDALNRYEQSVRPSIDRMLDANHERGLEMDSTSPDVTATLVAELQRLAADPAAEQAYSMRAAGY